MFSDFIQALKYFWINFFWVEPGVQVYCQILLHWFFSWTSRTLTLWCEQLRPVDFVHVSAVGLKVWFIQWPASPPSPRKPSRVTDEPTTIPALWNLTRAALPLPWRSSETRVGKIYASSLHPEENSWKPKPSRWSFHPLVFYFGRVRGAHPKLKRLTLVHQIVLFRRLKNHKHSRFFFKAWWLTAPETLQRVIRYPAATNQLIDFILSS